MISVHRTTEPPVLTRHKARWTQEYREARVACRTNPSKTNEKHRKNAEKKYNKPQVKDALKTMCGGKCVYCESHVPHISYGEIEHFRPKLRYPKLCFEWENLLLGCSRCNGAEYKGTKFPLACEGGPFINPCEEDPNTFFDFKFDPATGTANVIPKNTRGLTTERELGLNRPDLVKHRSGVVRKLAFIALHAKNGDATALVELKRYMQKDQEYAAFARAFHRKFNLP